MSSACSPLNVLFVIPIAISTLCAKFLITRPFAILKLRQMVLHVMEANVDLFRASDLASRVAAPLSTRVVRAWLSLALKSIS